MTLGNYVDYRTLYTIIVKDKYHIPIVKEQLDELYEATIFLKLDLRLEYHQFILNLIIFQKQSLKPMKAFMNYWSCSLP